VNQPIFGYFDTILSVAGLVLVRVVHCRIPLELESIQCRWEGSMRGKQGELSDIAGVKPGGI
jgi:hypothetical protein